jgi:hypothetical protein
MHALEWKQQVNGRIKVTPKDEVRKALGRSPDRYDACALAVWEPLSLHDEPGRGGGGSSGSNGGDDDPRPSLDPYAGAATWGRR